MRLPHMTILFMVFFLCFISCRETVGEQHDSVPKEKKVPSTQQKQLEKPVPEYDSIKRNTPNSNKRFKKEKTKTSDTLRPIVAIP